jgi:subtilisin family serine protease
VPAQPLQSADPTASLPVIASKEVSDPAIPGLIRRIRIVKASFKYPLWRVDEVVRPGGAGQTDTCLSRNIMIADHAMVRLNTNATVEALKTLVDTLGLSIRNNMKRPGCYLVSISNESVDALPQLLTLLNEHKDIISYAEPDYIRRSQQTIPNDPYSDLLWGLHNNTGTPNADIAARQAWDLSTGGTQVVVAVIDTGIDYTHPDLAANIWSNTAESVNGVDDDGNGYIDDVRGWNFSAGNNNPMDGHSHGTHCAGTVGAIGNNGTGVVGVNWHCRIMALKFLDNTGSGTDSDAVDALHYVAELRRRGVNIRLTSNSWGDGAFSTTLRDAIHENGDLGILFMAAAGNDSLNNDLTPFYPSSYTEANVIAVAATTESDGLASFSCYGATSVDLGAPGNSILSTMPGSSYNYKSGTSMATPHVAGVATLLWNSWPEASAGDIKDAILRGTDPLPALAGKTVTGGRLDAFKSFHALFRILHTPPGNTYNSGSDYPLTALIGPPGIPDTNQATLFWNADGSTNFSAIPLVLTSSTGFSAAIPTQPEGTTIHYWVQAVSWSNQVVRFPSNAPTATCDFTVVAPISLTITGSPSDIASVIPAYGTAQFASGKVVQASAPAFTTPSNGMRWACAGWTGGGSVPSSGSTNAVTFTLTNSSTLSWQWRHEIALVQTSRVVQSLNRTRWYADGALATTETAIATTTLSGTNYNFIGWTLDGLRQPDTNQPAINPVLGIPMTTPRVAEASYLPENQDSDGDGLGDWWEYFYFGTTNAAPLIDNDGDGLSNADEYQDRCNPRDPLSTPTPPAIIHTPLADPQPLPAPFSLVASITDNYTVASAAIAWSVNGGSTTVSPLVPGPGNTYRFTLPAPGSNGATFAYSIIASDLQASSTNGPNIFTVRYPIVSLAPSALEAILQPGTTRTLPLSITNQGGAALSANLSILWGGHSNAVESGTAGWNHSGVVDLWHLSTNRSTSGAASWYCGNPATRLYGSSMHAKLDSPPFLIAPGAQLSFNHWLQSELDEAWWWQGWLPNKCWDGAIVEISTNLGASFQQITPVGGYPNLISGYNYAAAPWPDLTPCFAGTGAWSTAVFDLSSFAGSVAIIRFQFGSDDNTEKEGWYLDDIVVSPVVTPQPWLTLATNLLTAPATNHVLVPIVKLDSTGIATGERNATLWITGNDPALPWTTLPVRMLVRSPATVSWVSAAQTSTNGTGMVTLSNLIHDADGDTSRLEFEWSSSSTGPWSNLWLTAVHADDGTAWLDNAQSPPVSNLVTRSGAILITNVLATTWDSQTSGCGWQPSSTTRVRARTWDELFCGNWVTSQPFMVDNEGPQPPASLFSFSHIPSKWSGNPAITFSWNQATDGTGIGIRNYLYGASADPLPGVTASTINRTATASPPGDGTNIWAWVLSLDRFGNTSTVTRIGPYWIDSGPPSPALASIALALSPFGQYCVGTNSVSGSWRGFTDSGTGILGYYISLQDRGGTTDGLWLTTNSGMLNALAMDATNTFHVWAKDKMGWIGQATKASFLALSANGDWDHDGLTNLGEEIAGFDASSASSVFRVGVASSTGSGNGFVIQWPGITNRHYSVYFNNQLSTTNWTLLPGCTNLTGSNGVMSVTDPSPGLSLRFYKISVSSP